MADVKKEKIAVMHSQGFVHKPFVFQDFARAVPQVEPERDEQQPDAVAPESAAPGFSEEQLQAARAEGEAAGREKGRAEAREEQAALVTAQNAQVLATLESLLARVDEEVAAYEAMREVLRGEMAGIVLAIARKLAGNALEAQPLGAVEGMVNECMTMLAGESRLSIAVCAELEAPLKEYLVQLRRDGQVMEVVADRKMQPGDCRIQWPGGKASRQQEELDKEIEGIVTRALSAQIDDK